jgi:predicted nucleic acid-binding protein
MTGNELLLDTNAVIGLIAGEAALPKIVEAFDFVSMSLHSLGELEYGAAKSARPEANR